MNDEKQRFPVSLFILLEQWQSFENESNRFQTVLYTDFQIYICHREVKFQNHVPHVHLTKDSSKAKISVCL